MFSCCTLGMYDYVINILPRSRKGMKYCDQRVCRPLYNDCLSDRISQTHVQTSRNFLYILSVAAACLCPPLKTVQYVMYFRFEDYVIILHNKTVRLIRSRDVFAPLCDDVVHKTGSTVRKSSLSVKCTKCT